MAAGIRGASGIVSLILIAGSIVLIFFVVLSGVKDVTPLNKTYFLKADTSTIASARTTSQWTYFYVCGEGNADCGDAVPALPFGYAWVGDTTGVPAALVGKFGKHTTSAFYYYVWRFGWVFYLIGLVFDVFGFFAALAAPFSRLASGLSGLITLTALFFFTVGASLMTVEFVKAYEVLKAAGMNPSYGKYAFGFTWAAWFALFLASLSLFFGCLGGGRKDETTTGGSKGGLFRRNRSKRSTRGSINYDNESQRRVKEEY